MTKADIYQFIAKQKLGVLGTFSSSGQQSALVGIAVTPELEIIFNTVKSSRKFQNLLCPSARSKGRKPLDLGAVKKRMIQLAFAKLGITRVGWHTFRHLVGSILADMGEHQFTIRDYLRHRNPNVTNQYLQATSNIKRLAQGKLVDAIVPSGSLSACKSSLIQ